MEMVRSAGLRPVLRATGAGAAFALLALLLFVRGLFELLDPLPPPMWRRSAPGR